MDRMARKASSSGFINLLLIALLVILLITLWYNLGSSKAMYPDDAKAAIKRQEIDHVVDVRSDAEWSLGKYPLAIHIPVNTIESALPQRIPDKKARILFYCNTTTRSRAAADIAEKMGYTNVRYLVGTHLNLLDK
jgi:rhodanese-related sulfurtransferase